ncbi:MAG: lipoyl synthase [Thermoanaerobaculaceae bacterium]|nr:lipoyl synthase [Thermoanaerobaculaceae bacterium]MDI9622618.1 lipoyl synthase [Acidobacteriota bacterium]HPW54633.1 lipoyl synthase [Thermoanaerobaculaceae bacterium]
MSGTFLPEWIRARKLQLGELHDMRRHMVTGKLHTVCDEARCPNRSDCFGRGTATFLIMGETCTRACRYCAVAHGRPGPLDPDEPAQLARTASELGLKHVVVTSVDRDDLPDGGAAHFAATVRALQALDPRPTIEVLTPDFRGSLASVDVVVASGPEVFNHNIETVRRLYPAVRSAGRYDWALTVLSHVAGTAPGMTTKSGLLVGLGETHEEVRETLEDLRRVGCRIVTVGQYLRPSREQVEVVAYWAPEEFAQLEVFGRSIGLEVVAGPFVRSSFRAEETLARTMRTGDRGRPAGRISGS